MLTYCDVVVRQNVRLETRLQDAFSFITAEESAAAFARAKKTFERSLVGSKILADEPYPKDLRGYQFLKGAKQLYLIAPAEFDLGIGAFGSVQFGLSEAGGYVAIKFVQAKTNSESVRSENEKRYGKRRGAILDFFANACSGNGCFFIYRYLGLPLNVYLKKNNETLTDEARETLAIKLVEEVIACHQAGIAHHDIKPENITVEENEAGDIVALHLIDYGFSLPAELSLMFWNVGESNLLTLGQVRGSPRHLIPINAQNEQTFRVFPRPLYDFYALLLVLTAWYGTCHLFKKRATIELGSDETQELVANTIFGNEIPEQLKRLVANFHFRTNEDLYVDEVCYKTTFLECETANRPYATFADLVIAISDIVFTRMLNQFCREKKSLLSESEKLLNRERRLHKIILYRQDPARRVQVNLSVRPLDAFFNMFAAHMRVLPDAQKRQQLAFFMHIVAALVEQHSISPRAIFSELNQLWNQYQKKEQAYGPVQAKRLC